MLSIHNIEKEKYANNLSNSHIQLKITEETTPPCLTPVAIIKYDFILTQEHLSHV